MREKIIKDHNPLVRQKTEKTVQSHKDFGQECQLKKTFHQKDLSPDITIKIGVIINTGKTIKLMIEQDPNQGEEEMKKSETGIENK